MLLPVADKSTVYRHFGSLMKDHRAKLGVVVALQGISAVAALAVPWLLGNVIDKVSAGAGSSYLTKVGLLMVSALALQTVFTALGQRQAMVLGETVFARLREEFLGALTHLPLSTVERAGTGDLLGRTTNDVNRVQWIVRFGVPRVLVLTATILLTLGAAVLASPLVALAMVAGVPVLLAVSRWYLKRATPAYLENSKQWAELNGTMSETVDHSPTVDALSLGARRRQRLREVLAGVWHWEGRVLYLRAVLFVWMGIGYALPTAAILLWGAWLVQGGLASVGAVATVAVYTVQIRHAVGELLFWVDELQVATASHSRILGVTLVSADRTASGQLPSSDVIVATDVRYAYRAGQDVLHGVSLDLRPGERLAVVGPSGAGKSTFGRMLAGIHPPTGGAVTVGGVPLVELTEEQLRSEVALVTQEHHVFVGTLADNLRLAKAQATAEEMNSALAAVDALAWVEALEEGIETEVGSGARELTPAQAQQLALARLVLLDPHTLVLDEATSLLDPGAARHLERSLSAVLEGRTVVAIAHRLHTAHDADRVAVMEGGRIVELGPHHELVSRGGEYAALWESWQQE